MGIFLPTALAAHYRNDLTIQIDIVDRALYTALVQQARPVTVHKALLAGARDGLTHSLAECVAK
jgi:hypothetical protein